MLIGIKRAFKSILQNHLNLAILAPLILFTLFSRTYDLEARFMFGWDQARDAEVIWKMLVEGKLTLIGPQVVSEKAFFLGPLWYYLLAPFYFLSGMDPLGAAFSAAVSAVATVIAIFHFFKKIAGLITAVVASLIWAGIPDTSAWNPMLVPLFTVVILFSISKIIEGKKKYIILASLLIGLSLQIHFQMVFFIPLFIFTLWTWVLRTKKIPLREILLGLGVFILTFLPLILFDLRHDFLNYRGFLKLFGIGTDNPENQTQYLIQLGIILPKFISSHFFLPLLPVHKMIPGSLLLLSSFIGIAALKTARDLKVILVTLIVLPVFIFSFYRGNLSEYYFVICTIPILLGFSNLLGMVFKGSAVGKVGVIIILLGISALNVNEVISIKRDIGLQPQRQTIKYLKDQKEDQLINVSFDVPASTDTSFKYLLKYYNLNPQNIPEAHLWTITIPADKEPNGVRAVFGDIGIIRR